MKHMIVGLLVASALAGCASVGVKVTDEQMASFKEGITTEADVIAALGAPTTRVRTADGSVTLGYSHAQYNTKAATFIPIVGLFAGGADMRSSAVILSFGKDGKLTNTSTQTSNMNTGVFNGTTYQTSVDSVAGK